jgi:hypothetical protein
MIQQYRGSSPPGSSLAFAFREMCRSILNPNSLTFVAANAPSDVVSSFQVHQQKLANLSLRVASTMLVQQLTEKEGTFNGSLSRVVQTVASKAKSALLLVACIFGRVSLGALRALRLGLPRRVQLGLSASLLKNLGNLFLDTEIASEPIGENLIDVNVDRNPSATLSIHKSPPPP